jgi:cardiolipin synthase
MSGAAILHFILPHLLSIVGFVLGAVLIANVLVERRPSGSAFAWVLAIVLIPYVGVPLYIVFGGRKLKQRAARKQQLYAPPAGHDGQGATITRMLCASGAPLPLSGNRVDFLPTGESAYASMVELLESARRTIHISTLILADDEVGRAVLQLLEKKAREGVQVRLLLDALFGFRASSSRLAAFRRAGGKVAWFMPVWHLPFRGHANLRLHRKIVVTDGQQAILGGMNIAREYMGPVPIEGRWRDISARVTGPAVEEIDAVFRADWKFASGETLEGAPVPPPAGEAGIQVVGSGPDVASDLIYDAFISGVFEAQRRLWIATPYFVPDEALARAMVLAVRRGVDVHIMVPARSNHLTADLAGASYLRFILENGGRISCYQPGMMHGKVVLVDDTMGVLGSANLDMRSLFLDYEIALFFSDRAQIQALATWFESLLPQCGPLAPARRGRVLVESVARLFGPLA